MINIPLFDVFKLHVLEGDLGLSLSLLNLELLDVLLIALKPFRRDRNQILDAGQPSSLLVVAASHLIFLDDRLLAHEVVDAKQDRVDELDVHCRVNKRTQRFIRELMLLHLELILHLLANILDLNSSFLACLGPDLSDPLAVDPDKSMGQLRLPRALEAAAEHVVFDHHPHGLLELRVHERVQKVYKGQWDTNQVEELEEELLDVERVWVAVD